jgi:4-aminobutyrate aminotransferase-like enzyme
MQIGNRFTTTVRARLAERLAAIAPDPLGMTFFCSTGSEANELALRLAKLVTDRHEVVALARGYHGRTLAAFTLSTSTRRAHARSGPLMAGTQLALPPYEHRCPFECSSCDLRCFDLSRELIDRGLSGEPAAFIVEFVLGAGGIIPVPAEWARAVREWCTSRSVLMIADEALTGIGRTGRWFAFEHTGVVPDIVVVSKALGGGVPAAAVITSPDLAREAIKLGFVGSASHQGDPFQCAGALINIEIIEEEGLLDNAAEKGALLERLLAELAGRYPRLVSDTRGVGLIQGIEISSDGAEAPDLAAEVSVACMERGLLLGGLRPGIREGNTLRLAPPLIVDEQQVRDAVEILESALADVSGRHELGGAPIAGGTPAGTRA